MIAVDLLGDLDRHFGYPKPDRRGERWVACPLHGERRDNSFSYSERGFNCFACGESGGLRKLAEALGIAERQAGSAVPLPRPRPKPTPKPAYHAHWRDEPNYWRRFQPLSEAAYAYAHSRGLSDRSLERWRFGSGAPPLCRCGRERLILPVFQGECLVGLRGRLVPEGAQLRPCLPDPKGEPCQHDKWLPSAGGETVLFGTETLGAGRTVIVTEAPLSCVLLMQERPEIACVASTAGCGTWREEWTARVAASQPTAVLVWMDRDGAGEKAATKVADELARARLPVHRYRWPAVWPEKSDLADVVVAEMRGRAAA